MADALAELQQRVKEARAAEAWISEAKALNRSSADVVTFTCSNPPYSGLFSVALPRALWQPALEQAIDDAQAKVDAVTTLATAS